MSVFEIPDHHGAAQIAVGRLDRQPKRARIGLVHGKAAAPANRREAVRRREFFEEQARHGLGLVGADGETKPRRPEPIERRERAGKEAAFVGDMRLIVNEKVANQRIRARQIERRALAGEAALDQRPRAGPDERPRGLESERRQPLAQQQDVERADEIMRGVGQRAVEIENQNWGADRHGVRA